MTLQISLSLLMIPALSRILQQENTFLIITYINTRSTMHIVSAHCTSTSGNVHYTLHYARQYQIHIIECSTMRGTHRSSGMSGRLIFMFHPSSMVCIHVHEVFLYIHFDGSRRWRYAEWIWESWGWCFRWLRERARLLGEVVEHLGQGSGEVALIGVDVVCWEVVERDRAWKGWREG